jgi:hypothetical protein
MLRSVVFSIVIMMMVCSHTIYADSGEIVIADFEGEDYGSWQIEGEAFGTNPRWRETEAMEEISGFEGKGLATSYQDGDRPRGTLTSPEFTIERDHIVFLISGGEDRRRTCMNLHISALTISTKVIRRVNM